MGFNTGNKHTLQYRYVLFRVEDKFFNTKQKTKLNFLSIIWEAIFITHTVEKLLKMGHKIQIFID